MRAKSICLALVVGLLCSYASAQWIQTNGPSGGNVSCLAASGTDLFAGTNGGVFLTTNNGTSWTAVNNGLPTNTSIQCLAVSGTNLFAGTGGGVFLSTNNGTSWTATSTGLTNTDARAFAVSGTNIFAGTCGGGVFLSTNNGTSWTAVAPLSWEGHDCVRALAMSGTNLFVSFSFPSGRGVSVSTTNGASWMGASAGLPNPEPFGFAVSGTNIFAAHSGGGVFLLTNISSSWTAESTGLTDTFVNALAVSGTDLLAGTVRGSVWRRPLSQMITSVREIAGNGLPERYTLEQNYPNPFNPATTIEFALPKGGHVSLKVFNLLGEEVGSLVSKNLPAGKYSTEWNAGNVASGVHFYRLVAGSFVETKKMLVLK